MEIQDILTVDAVEADCSASSKKAVLRQLAERMQELFGFNSKTLLHALMAREKLGSTGIGEGTAIPHACLEEADTIRAVFARLQTSVEFDAIDDCPVDLVLLLVVPKESGASYLKLLASVARKFRNARVRDMLRGASNAAAIYAVLTSDMQIAVDDDTSEAEVLRSDGGEETLKTVTD